MHFLGGDAEMQVRGAGDQRHLARLGHAEPDHADEGIGAALHHRYAGLEAQMLGGRLAEGVDDVARPHDGRRPFLRQLGEAELGQQRRRQAALAALVVPAHRHVVERGDPAAGQAPVDVVLVFAHAGRALEQLRLVALHPQGFRDHPLGRDRPAAVAVDAQRGIAARRDVGGFGGGAHIHPDHRRAQRRAICVHRHHRAAGGVHAQRDDLIGGGAGCRDRAAHRFAEAAPPVLRVLLGPARLGELRLIGAGVRALGPALGIEQDRADALRPAVDAQEISHAVP